MKNRVTKRLLSWFMSAVMIVGEFGGMPLTANAQEDTLIEDETETEEAVLTEEAAIVDDVAFCTSEEASAGSEDEASVVEEAQNDPVVRDINLTLTDLEDDAQDAYTWEPFEVINPADYGETYRSKGKDYLPDTWYDYAVQYTGAGNNPIVPVGTTDLTITGQVVQGYLPVDRILMDMIMCDMDDNTVNFASGDYKLYVFQGDAYTSPASAQTFYYTAYEDGGAAPQAEWYCYYNKYVKRIVDEGTEENPIKWSYENYSVPQGSPWPDSCPDGWEEQDEYQLNMTNSDTIIGYIITGKDGDYTAKILDRNGDQRVTVYAGDDEIAGKATVRILAEKNYPGFKVCAVRRNGTISPFASPVKMSPMAAENMAQFTAELTINESLISFTAPEISKDMGIAWTDNKGTDDPVDDEAHVNITYQLYISKNTPENDAQRYIEINDAVDTLRVNNTDTTYIDKNTVLFYMMKECGDNADITSGDYTVWIVTGNDRGRIYNTNTFSITYTRPQMNPVIMGKVYVDGNLCMFKEESYDDGSVSYFEYHADGLNEDQYREAALAAGYDVEKQHIRVYIPEEAGALGYVVKVNAFKYEEHAYNYRMEIKDEFTVIYGNNPDGRYATTFDFISDSKDIKIEVLAYHSSAYIYKYDVLGRCWFDELEKEARELTVENNVLSWTNIEGVTIEERHQGNTTWYETADNTGYQLSVRVIGEPFVAQGLNLNQLIRPESTTKISVDLGELVMELVRNKDKYNLMDGNYLIEVTGSKKAGNTYVKFCLNNRHVINISPGQIKLDVAAPEALYSLEKRYVKTEPDNGGRQWRDNKNTEEYDRLTDEEKAAYLEKKELSVILRSADRAVIGYLIKAADDNTVFQVTPDDLEEKDLFSVVSRDYEERFRGSTKACIMDKDVSVEDIHIKVAAVYSDGKISTWSDGREKTEIDEFYPFDLHIHMGDYDLSWDQKYDRYDNDSLVYYDQSGAVSDADHGSPRASFSPQFYIAGANNSSWCMRLDDIHDITWDADNNRASVKKKDLFERIFEMKYVEAIPEMANTDRYMIYVVVCPWYNDTNGRYNGKGYEAYEGYKLFTATGCNIIYRNVIDNLYASYEYGDWWIAGNTNPGEWFLETDRDTEGYRKVKRCRLRFRSDEDVLGYLIYVPNESIYSDPSDIDKEQHYYYVPAGKNAQGQYTTMDQLFLSDIDAGMKVATVGNTGTVSYWRELIPYSLTDDYVQKNINTIDYGELSGNCYTDLSDFKADLVHYDQGRTEALDGDDGYIQIADAALIFRGVYDYEADTRVLRKENHYETDIVSLPAVTARDYLKRAAGITDGTGRPWMALEPGTYQVGLLVKPQNTQETGGLASMPANEKVFTFMRGLEVAAPEAGTVTYRYDTDPQGKNYHINIQQPGRDVVAYIVKYKTAENKYDYEAYPINGTINGYFGEYSGDIRICAVNAYGDISEFVSILAEIEEADTSTFNTADCVKDYPIGYNINAFALDGATIKVRKFDSTEYKDMDIYSLAEETGGVIEFGFPDGFNFSAEADNVQVDVKLKGGKLNGGQPETSRLLGRVSLNVINKQIVSISSTLALDKASYVVHDIVQLASGKVVITYDDGSKRELSYDSNALSLNYDVANPGENVPVSVYLDGAQLQTYASAEAAKTDVIFYVEVVNYELQSISVIPPVKRNYFIREAIDTTGGSIKLLYNNGYIEYVGLYMGIIRFDSSSANDEAVVKVTYGVKEASFTVSVREPRVISIVDPVLTRITYIEGESLDLTGASFTAIYENATDVRIYMTAEGVSIPDISKLAAGEHEIIIGYKGATVACNIVINEKLIDGIVLSTAPKTVYAIGEKLDLTGGKIRVTYTNTDAVDEFDLTDISDKLNISGFRNDIPGEHRVTFVYRNKSFNLDIQVKGVTEIVLKSQPAKLSYFEGEDLNLGGGVITVTFADGGEEDVVITDEMISGYDKNTVGVQTVTVNFSGKSITFNVTVIAIEVTSIAITTQPARTEFFLNEDIVVTGAKITATFNDGTTEQIDITAAMISGYDKTKSGEQTVTVTYGGKTATFVVTVLAKTVTAIEILTKPTKLVYDYNTDLDAAGGKIKVTFNNGETETIDMTAAMISGFDKTKAGKQTLTVTYGGKTATFEVTVNAKPEEQQTEPGTSETPETPEDDYYEFDPTIQEEPVVGEGMKVFFDDASLIPDADGVYHITYTGKAIKPVVRVTDNRVILIEGVDYKVSYKDNVKAGTATVTIKGNGSYDAKETLSFVIDKRSITEAEIGGMVSTRADKVSPVLTFGGKVLVNKKDYKFTIDDGSVEFEGIGSFEGTTSETIEVVTAKELSKLGIKVKFSEKLPEFIYDGTPKTIDEYLVVTDGSKEETAEYSVSYSDNVNAGTVTVWIVGTGSHKGKIKKTFKIKPNKDASFEVSYPKEVKYNVKGAKPYVVVSANETFELLTPGVDYSVKYLNNKKGGATGSFSITFKGNYKGAKYDKDTSFKILKPEMNKAEANVSGNYIITTDMVFKKSGKYQPKTYVIVDGKLLKNSEYTLDYSEKDKLTGAKDNLTITATAKDDTNYAGKAVVSYNVIDGTGKTELNKSKIVLTNSGKSKIYEGAGSEVTLTPGTDFTVKVGSTSIEKAEDITKNFNIYYANNNAVGKATIIVQGKGDYVGLLTKTFTIKKAVIKKK